MRQAIVIAGGFGTRLREVVPDLPKPMAPVAGRPFLEYLLTELANSGFGRVVLALGYMAERITGHFGDSFKGMELSYEIEHAPLGTGGAVRRALAACTADHVFVFNGDTFMELDLDALERCWREWRELILVAREVEDTARYGRLQVKHGRIVEFEEKGVGGPGLINAGCYVVPRDALDMYELDQPFSLEQEFLLQAVSERSIRVFVSDGFFIDIGVPEDYARAQHELVRTVDAGGTR